MEESDTYLAIVDEGREKATKQYILRLGKHRFGAPSESQVQTLEGTADLERLERILDRLFDAANWDDFLETP